MYIADFLQWLHDEGKDEKTISAYKTTINQFFQWFQDSTGRNDFSDAKPIDIKEYLGFMKHTLNRKQATVNKTIASFKTFFAFLSDNGLVKDNPMTRIKIQKVESSDKVGEKGISKWLNKEEQDRYMSYVNFERNEFKRLRNLAIIDCMLFAGLRVAEVEELRIDDVKVTGDITLTIREGKKGKYTTANLINKHSRNLRNWLRMRQGLSGDKYTASAFLFVSERSGKLSARGIQVMLDKYADLANMGNITPHRFRHSFCKNLANAGVAIEIIRRLARHESIQTTAIYIDPSHEEQLKALYSM